MNDCLKAIWKVLVNPTIPQPTLHSTMNKDYSTYLDGLYSLANCKDLQHTQYNITDIYRFNPNPHLGEQ